MAEQGKPLIQAREGKMQVHGFCDFSFCVYRPLITMATSKCHSELREKCFRFPLREWEKQHFVIRAIVCVCVRSGS